MSLGSCCMCECLLLLQHHFGILQPASSQGSASSPLWGCTQLLRLWAFSSWRFKWFSAGLGIFQLCKSGFKCTECPLLLHVSLCQPARVKSSWCCRSSSRRGSGCKSLHQPPVKRQKKNIQEGFCRWLQPLLHTPVLYPSHRAVTQGGGTSQHQQLPLMPLL